MENSDFSEPGVAVDKYDDSMILYTSGTTGKPKGAVLTHHNQMVLTTSVASMVGIGPDDRIIHAAPLFHAAELNLFLNPGTYMGPPTWLTGILSQGGFYKLLRRKKSPSSLVLLSCT